MTNRKKMLNVLNHKKVEAIPVSIRLDLWYNHAKLTNILPEEVKNLSCEEIEDYLGFCRTARFRNYYELVSENCRKLTERIAEDTITTYEFKNRILHGVKRLDPASRAQGMAAILVEYPIKEIDDYACIAQMYQKASIKTREADYRQFDQFTGDKGLPLIIINSDPTHEVMLNFVGYEKFYMDYFDAPDEVSFLIEVMDKFYRHFLWPTMAKSEVKLILHGNHFSQSMTPKPLFERFFIPYYRDFCEFMHQHDKLVGFHSDADLGELIPCIPEMGFDVADCLATAPLVKENLEDYYRIWNGKVTCWGGLPSVIFAPEYSVPEFKRYVDDTLKISQGRNDFILGASDNVMPGTQWEKIQYLSTCRQG